MNTDIFTIGHSTHEIGTFMKLLTDNSIDLICDVRSSPYSQYNPQFNREVLKKSLQENEIKYHFMGFELGGRTNNPAHLKDGRVQYQKIAETEKFNGGLKKLIHLAEKHTVAIMCSEKDPLTCHRAILVGRQLQHQNFNVYHILDSGEIEDKNQFEDHLLEALNIPKQLDMFQSVEDIIERAYDTQGQKVAYVMKEDKDE